jgi:phage I-like protein
VIAGGKRELVWRNGVNETDLGPIVWNDKARRSVMSRYAQRGNPILLDINHQYNEDERAKWEVSGAQPPTAGNGLLETDAQGNLWLVPEWSATARAKIDAKELRFLSPDFAYDKKTREVLEIYRVSLVAEPGTWHARMVASAKRKGRLSMNLTPEALAKLSELFAALEKEQVSDGVKTLITEVMAMMAGNGDAAPEAPEMDLAKQPLPGMMGKLTNLAERAARRRLDIENARLSASLRGKFADELKASGARALTPAEEKELSTYTDPASLEKAIGLLKTSGRDKRAEIHREPERKHEQIGQGGESSTPKPGGYVEALNRLKIGGAV